MLSKMVRKTFKNPPQIDPKSHPKSLPKLYQKIAFSISMNVANKTFLSGMEPLVSMFSGDEGAFNRFLVSQADSLIPFAPSGMRSVLNQAISPQLKDVENDWGS